MSARGKPHSGRMLHGLVLLLFLSQVLFIWMFLSAESIEQVVRQNCAGNSSDDMRIAGDHFASQWRHGMAENSPLYMPGFFLTAAFTWLWSLGRPPHRLILEGLPLLLAATLVAALLSPLGTVRAVKAFEQLSGLRCPGGVPSFTYGGALMAIYTLFTWSAGMVCIQLAIADRSIRPMWIPIALNIVLARVRPWTVNDFTDQWFRDLLQGKSNAILSIIALPVLAAFMVLYQLHRERAAHRGQPP